MSDEAQPVPWRELRAELEALGFRPSKSLGQNFLLDRNLARAIVNDARVERGDRVLEVGCGPGALTEPLLERGVELLAVEIDARLLALARSRLGGFSNARFLEADVLATKHRLAPRVEEELWKEGAWHVVSNLPYAIAGPLLVSVSRLDNPPRTLTVLVQQEVADRIVARPGGEAWGALSAKLALLYDRRKEREVGRQLFWPRPRVQSAVVRLEARGGARIPEDRLEACDRLLAIVFQTRRKTLRNALSRAFGSKEEALAALLRLGVDPAQRPEELVPEQWLALAEVFRSSKHSS